jgi:nitroreductase
VSDDYQQRYLEHQARKADVLRGLLAERHSARVFAERPVGDEALALLLEAAEHAPSSCARRGVNVRVVSDRDSKALLGGLLVGGVGWIHRAPVVLLLIADPVAYKAGDEIAWMPFLDAGVMAGQMGLAAVAAGLRGCFVNPNVRPAHRDMFTGAFGPGIMCGAFAVGWPREDDRPGWVWETS